MFYIVLLLLLVLASTFIIWPFVTAHNQNQHQQDVDRHKKANIKAYHDRLEQIEQLELNQIEKQTQIVQSQRQLLADETDQSFASNQHNTPKWVPIGLVLLICLGSWLWYGQLGFEKDVVLFEAKIAANKNPGPDTGRAYIEAFDARMQANPEDVFGWYMFGQTLAGIGDSEKAKDAFAQAVIGMQNNNDYTDADKAVVYSALAQMKFGLNDQQFDDEIRELLTQTLQFNPQERSALGLLGMDAFVEGDFDGAVGHWQALYDILSDEEKLVSPIAGYLARAKQMGGNIDQPVGAQLMVSLSLDPALAEQAAKAKALFVVARKVGERMPVAVQRFTDLSNLPEKVKLDDSSAMGPMAKLSDQQQVEVFARYSMSGEVSKQAGDVESLVQTVDVAQEQLLLLIDQQVK